MSLVDVRSLPPRLVDYVLIVGSASPPASVDGVQNPKVLRRFPEEDLTDFPLPPDIVFFCQPDGCYLSRLAPAQSAQQQKLFVFCLTEKDSNKRRFGVCLNFFRPCRAPRTLFDSRHSAENDSSTDGGQLSSLRGHSQAEEVSSSVSSDKRPAEQCVPAVPPGTQFLLTSVCLLSHHGFFAAFKEILTVFRGLVEGAGQQHHAEGTTAGTETMVDYDALCDTENGWKRIIHKQIDTDPESNQDTLANDLLRWVNRLLQAPVPVPGQSRVELEVAVTPTLTLAYPDNSRFALLDFPLHLPLDLLGPQLMTRIISVVILEQKVLFQSRDYNILSMCVMAVVAMLFPLEYLFPVIPILPTSLPNAETLLLAPSPYLIGIPASFLNPRRGIMLPDDVFLVDIDSGRLDEPPSTDIPNPPPRTLQLLKQRLEKAVAALHNPISSPKHSGDKAWPQHTHSLSTSATMSSHRVTGFFSMMQHQASDGSGLSSDNTSSEDDEEGRDSLDGLFSLIGYDFVAVDIFIRATMVKFLYSSEMLANYDRFLRPIRLYSRPVVILQKTAFLKSVRGGASPFLIQLADSQALEAFGEFDLNPTTTVHRRILQGMVDPSAIGDKEKYFKDNLPCTTFCLFDSCHTLSGIMLGSKAFSTLTDTSDSSSDDDSTSSSSLVLITDDDEDDDDEGKARLVKVDEGKDEEGDEPVVVVRRSIINSSDKKQSAEDIIRSAHQFLNGNSTELSDFIAETPSNTTPPSLSNDVSDRQKANDKPTETSPKASVTKPEQRRQLSASSESSFQRSADGISPQTLGWSTQDSTTGEAVCIPSLSVTSESGRQYRQVRVTARRVQHRRASGDGPSTPLHSQRQRLESNYRRRPSPLRTRSLSFTNPVDLRTGLVDNDDETHRERRASDVQLRQNYDEAIFGGLLGHGDHKQESQAMTMEARWLKSHKDYAMPLRQVYNPFPTTRNSIVNTALFGLTPQRSPSSSFSLGQAKDLVDTRENRKFITELTNGVLDGRGVPWYHKRKMERLLLVESMRMVVVSTISEATGVSKSANSVPDVWLCKPVYKGILAMLKAVLAGVENTVDKGYQEPISSAYHVLELAYSHFTGVIQEGELAEGAGMSAEELNKKAGTPQSPVSSTSSKEERPNAPGSPFEEITLNELTEDPPRLPETGPIELNTFDGREQNDAFEQQQLEWSRPNRVDFSAMRKNSKEEDDSPQVPGRRQLLIPPQAMSPEQRERHEHLVTAMTVAASSEAFTADHQPEVLAYPDVFNRRKEGIKRARPHSNIIKPGVNAEHYIYVGGEVVALDTLPGNDQSKSTKSRPRTESTGSLSCNQRCYLYEDFIGRGNGHRIWESAEFWETLFGDLVASERLEMGLNENPVQLIERFRRLSSVDRQHLEHEEDLSLTGLLVNLAAFMIAMGVPHNLITSKIRRLVGRAHIGLQFSQHVYDILKVLQAAKGNAFELWPLRSRQLLRQDFMVHQGDDVSGETLMIEVSDLAIRVVVVGHGTKHRWFYEDIVRANYHPGSGVLCLWVREEDGVIPYNFCAKKKGRQLYKAVETYINDSSAPVVFGNSITGQFPVRDGVNDEDAILTLSMSGLTCKFKSNRLSSLFISITDIQNCSADGDNFLVNVLEESGEEKKYHFISVQVPQIIQTMMNIFSVVSAREKARTEPLGSADSSPSNPVANQIQPKVIQVGEQPSLEAINEVEESSQTPSEKEEENEKKADGFSKSGQDCEHSSTDETDALSTQPRRVERD